MAGKGLSAPGLEPCFEIADMLAPASSRIQRKACSAYANPFDTSQYTAKQIPPPLPALRPKVNF